MAVDSIGLLKQTYDKLCETKACARLILETKRGQCFATLAVKQIAGNSSNLKRKPKRKSPSTLRRNFERSEKFRKMKSETVASATKTDDEISSSALKPVLNDVSDRPTLENSRGRKRQLSSEASSNEASFGHVVDLSPIPQIDGGWENPIPGWSLHPENPSFTPAPSPSRINLPGTPPTPTTSMTRLSSTPTTPPPSPLYYHMTRLSNWGDWMELDLPPHPPTPPPPSPVTPTDNVTEMSCDHTEAGFNEFARNPYKVLQSNQALAKCERPDIFCPKILFRRLTGVEYFQTQQEFREARKRSAHLSKSGQNPVSVSWKSDAIVSSDDQLDATDSSDDQLDDLITMVQRRRHSQKRN